MSTEQVIVPLKVGEQTLRELLRGVFEITKTRLGAFAILNALFRAKGLNGLLLAVIFSHVPTLHAQLTATNSLARHRFEDIPIADLTAHQFRELLAYYYSCTIRTLESATSPEESTEGMALRQPGGGGDCGRDTGSARSAYYVGRVDPGGECTGWIYAAIAPAEWRKLEKECLRIATVDEKGWHQATERTPLEPD
jgi:hypothetical protein